MAKFMARITSFSSPPSLPFPSVLYPNLAELENYMGLSLSSQEVQQSLPQTPEGASVGICLLPDAGPPSLVLHLNRFVSPLSMYSIPEVLFLDDMFPFEPS